MLITHHFLLTKSYQPSIFFVFLIIELIQIFKNLVDCIDKPTKEEKKPKQI